MAQRRSGRKNPANKVGHHGALMKKVPTGVNNGSFQQKQGKVEPTPSRLVKQPIKQSIPTDVRRVSKRKQDKITYVLDSNVLMYSWDSLFQFDEHYVCIVSQVWQELDRHKEGKSDVAWNVRKVTRLIDELIAGRSHEELHVGVELALPEELQGNGQNTGKLLFDFSQPKIPSDNDFDLSLSQPDDRIIMNCLDLKRVGRKVVLITNDVNCRVRASVCGIKSEEYLHEAVVTTAAEEDISCGFHQLPNDLWEKVGENFALRKDGGVNIYEFNHAMFRSIHCNEFIILPPDGASNEGPYLRVVDKPSPHKVVARSFDCSRYEGTIKPRNLEQKFALECLFDTSLPAVSLAGPAGSGKTYLALAAAFHLTLEDNHYKRVIVTRSPVDSDRDIGFLPGDEEEKMCPWLGGIEDNLDSFLGSGEASRGENQVSIDYLKQRMNIQIKSLNFMRGRSFEDTFIIVDEVQDIPRKVLKMMATRVGLGSKIVFLGNFSQIDNTFLTEHTCGMSVLIRAFTDSKLMGHVTLKQGERSAFANESELRI